MKQKARIVRLHTYFLTSLMVLMVIVSVTQKFHKPYDVIREYHVKLGWQIP
jgi:hypothetical protein